jgi:hypothetical protein
MVFHPIRVGCDSAGPAEHCSLQQNGRPRFVATRALPHRGPQWARQRGRGCSRVWSLRRRKQRASAGGPPIRLQSEASGHRVSSFCRATAGNLQHFFPREQRRVEPRDQPAAHSRSIPATPQRCGCPRVSPAQAAPHHALKRDQRRVSLLAQRRRRARARGSGAGASWAYGHAERSGERRVLQGARSDTLQTAGRCWTRSRIAEERRICCCCGTACSAWLVAPVLQEGKAARTTEAAAASETYRGG